MSNYRNRKFLYKLKEEISNLPWDIWENSDLENSDYNQKRKELICRVMHIDFKLQGFVNKRYGNSQLLNELNSYSFLPKNCMYDTFNVENNKIWRSGKKSYLGFIDKLLDFEEAERTIESESIVSLITKILILIIVAAVSSVFIFLDYIVDDIYYPCNLTFKYI